MISVIFRYYNENGDEKIAIGSPEYFKTRVKTCKQLVERLAWEHSAERWGQIRDMKQEELMQILSDTLQSEVLHTIRPN